MESEIISKTKLPPGWLFVKEDAGGGVIRVGVGGGRIKIYFYFSSWVW